MSKPTSNPASRPSTAKSSAPLETQLVAHDPHGAHAHQATAAHTILDIGDEVCFFTLVASLCVLL